MRLVRGSLIFTWCLVILALNTRRQREMGASIHCEAARSPQIRDCLSRVVFCVTASRQW